jgi:transcriptional regulator with XRE-family HTH domain
MGMNDSTPDPTPADAVNAWLNRHNCSLAELARLADIDPSELSKLRHGVLSRLSWEKAGRISRVTTIPMSRLGYPPIDGSAPA